MSNIFQIKRGGTEPPYIETDDTTPNSSKSYYTKNGNTYTLFESSEFAQGTTYYENVLKKYELGFNTSTDTLYINNNGTIEVPFARVKVNNIDGTLPVSKGGTGQTAITASRLLYSKSTTQLASTSITSDGSYLGNISYLTINAAHQTDWRFYVNGSAMLSSNSVWYVQDSRYNASTNPSSDVWGAGFYMNDSNGTTRAYVREMALTNGWQGIQTEAKRVVNNASIYATLNLLIDANGNRQAVLNSKLYANEGLSVTGNLSVTGTIAGNELYSGDDATTADRHIICRSQAGIIFLYSNGSNTTGERGIWLAAHGTGAAKPVFSVDTNNNITYGASTNNFTIHRETSIANNSPAQLTLTVYQTDNKLTGSGYIRLYDDLDTGAYGNNMVINSGGNMFIGGGESPQNLYDTGYKTNTGEDLYLSSDGQIYFFVNCQTIANRFLFTLNSSNQFQRGLAGAYWYNGRDKALLRGVGGSSSYCPVISMKGSSSSWEYGVYDNDMAFAYVPDTSYNGSTNNNTRAFCIYYDGRAGFSLRNISYGTDDPSASSGAVGDIYIKYS